jgi:hypothetical protein
MIRSAAHVPPAALFLMKARSAQRPFIDVPDGSNAGTSCYTPILFDRRSSGAFLTTIPIAYPSQLMVSREKKSQRIYPSVVTRFGRYTELNADQKILVKQLKLTLPSQPPPRITATFKSRQTLLPV